MAVHRSVFVAVAFLLTICSTIVAETIDLQWAICGHNNHAALRRLGLHGVEPYKAHNITYYDTSPPVYTAKGLAFRTKVKGNQPISMIKARFPEELKDVPDGAECVWDRYGHTVTYTCSLASPYKENSTLIWSNEQIDFVSHYQILDWTRLVPYGPFWNPKWKIKIAGHKAKFDDVMAHVDGKPLHLMEIEMRVEKSEQKHVYKKVTKYLKKHHVHLCKHQISKTLRLFNAMEKSSPKTDEDEIVIMDELK